MEFRRSGQRRRRVLLEESRTEAPDSADESPAQDTRGYNESALCQPSLTDLIPVHPLRVLLTVAAGVAVLAALVLLDDWAASAARNDSPFRLGSPGNLASWFASTLLMWAAGGAVLTFLIRRHRTDDYRGVYYIWVWAAAMLLLASVSATAPWHRELNTTLATMTGIDLGANGWWLSTVGVAGGLMLVRIAIEIRPCRTALALLLTAVAGYTMVALVNTGVVLSEQPALGELCGQLGTLGSHLTLAYAVWWNARHVQLDARGVHAERAQRRAESRAAREERRTQRRLAMAEKRAEKQAGRKSESPAAEAAEATPKRRRRGEPPEEPREEPEEEGRRGLRVAGKRRRPSTPEQEEDQHADEQASDTESDSESADTLDLEEGRRASKSDRRKQRKQSRGRLAA